MPVNHAIRIRGKVFLPTDLVPENTVLYAALKDAKAFRETSEADNYDTACMCALGGIPLVIRRSGGNDLFLARWPQTGSDHAAMCHFRLSGSMPDVRSDQTSPVTPMASWLLNWDFGHAQPGVYLLPGGRIVRRASGKAASVPHRRRDSLVDLLCRMWEAAGLSIPDSKSPTSWFEAINRIIPAARKFRFGANLPLEDYLRIWSTPDHRNVNSFNATVDVSGNFLVLGEVYSLLQNRYKGFLPFRHFPSDIKVFMSYEKVRSAIGNNTALEQASDDRSSNIVGLAHVTNTGSRFVTASLALLLTNERYVPVRT